MSTSAPQNAAGPMTFRPPHLRQQASATAAAGGAPDPLSEIGTSGLKQSGGFVMEEWLRQLSGRKGAWAYREMADNDPVVGAFIYAVRWLLRRVDWRIAEDKSDEQTAEFVEQCMHDMSHTWGDFISEALSFITYGWAFHEIVYKRRQGYQAPRYGADDTAALAENVSNPASSQYDDGKIGWRKLPVRAQETLLRWHFDGYSGLSALEQIDWHGGDHIIPIEKALLFRTEKTRNNPEGRSMLRNAFVSYYRLKNIQTIESIGIERELAGIPVIAPPDDVDIYADKNADLLREAQQLVANIRNDTYEGVVKPSAGWTLELMSSSGSRAIDTDTVIRRYEQRIASSVLADFILLGQDAVGSFAMVDVKADVFGIALDSICDMICEVFNRHGIPRLLRLNGMDATRSPTLEHSSPGRIDLEKVGAFLNSIALAGAPIPWSEELMEALFSEAGLPANFEGLDEKLEAEENEPDVPPPPPPPAPAPPAGEQPASEPGAKTPAEDTVPEPASAPEKAPAKQPQRKSVRKHGRRAKARRRA